MGLVSMLPEGGRTNLIKQVIASRAGQSKVKEFYPENSQNDTSTAQQTADAMGQVADMKVGVPPVPVPTQNPMIFSGVFMQAMEGAAQSIQQGADPHEGLAFIEMALPATAQHVQRMAQDKTRAPIVKEIGAKLHEIGQFSEQVKQKLAEQQQQRQQAQQQMQAMQQGQDPEMQIGMAKVQSKHQVDMAKLQAKHQVDVAKFQVNTQLRSQEQQVKLGMDAHRHAVDTAISDAEAAAGIHRDAALARAKVVNGATNKP